MYFETSYKTANFGENFSYIEAATYEEADRLATKRGIGEVISSNKRSGILAPARMVVDLFAFLSFPEVTPGQRFHALSWVGWLALASGVATPEDFFGDGGIIHDYAHHIESKENNPGIRPERPLRASGGLDALWRRAADIANKIPGFVFTPYEFPNITNLLTTLSLQEKIKCE